MLAATFALCALLQVPAAADTSATVFAPGRMDGMGGMAGFQDEEGDSADTSPTVFAPGEMDGLAGMEDFDDFVEAGTDTSPTVFAPGRMDGMGGMAGYQDGEGDPVHADPSKDPVYRAIMSQQHAAAPHLCHAAITSDPLDGTKRPYPYIWCDFQVPVGVSVQAEIRAGGCDEFREPASGDAFARGVASAVLLPEVALPEGQRGGAVDHAYCARVDYLYMAGAGGRAGSVLDRRFPVEVTYRYSKGGELRAIQLMDGNTAGDARDLDLILGLAFLAGSIFAVAMIAIMNGERRKKRKKEIQQRKQMMEDGVDAELWEQKEEGGDVEIRNVETRNVEIREENEIL